MNQDEFNIEVVKAEYSVVQSEDGNFSIFNFETKQEWPITKGGMIWLAQNLDSWFKEITKDE